VSLFEPGIATFTPSRLPPKALKIGSKWHTIGAMGMKGGSRRRWQIELRRGDEETIELIEQAFGVDNEGQAGRELLSFWKRIAEAVRAGQVVALQRSDDPQATDAFPDITRALRPDAAYDFLVRLPHPWRRQLVIKGRRQTAAQLIADMRANGWDIDAAAREFDLDRRAVVEALHYVERHVSLITAEADEERRRLQPHLHHAPAAR
jgi:uncharacterized protein (DUF433 family)